jgi:hypothetical protein
MKCIKIEAHIKRDKKDTEKISKTIVAFNQRFHLDKIIDLQWGEAVVVYLPEEEINESS